MIIKQYPECIIDLAKKYISCDALLIITMDAIARKSPLSLIRMGDGEASIMRGAKKAYLTNEMWLNEYGVKGCDLFSLGEQLKRATEQADWYCPSISGLVYRDYEIISLGANRKQYGEGLFAYTWSCMGRVKELMENSGGVGIVCRNSLEVADRLFMKYGKPALGVECAEYSSWNDYEFALEEIGKMKSHLVLVAGGPSAKMLCVEASKKHGKVVIDIGSALIKNWSV